MKDLRNPEPLQKANVVLIPTLGPHRRLLDVRLHCKPTPLDAPIFSEVARAHMLSPLVILL